MESMKIGLLNFQLNLDKILILVIIGPFLSISQIAQGNWRIADAQTPLPEKHGHNHIRQPWVQKEILRESQVQEQSA